MLPKYIAPAAFAVCAAGLPSYDDRTTSTTRSSATPTPSCKIQQRDATFDDITVIPAVELNPVPTPYMGLDYQAFDVLEVVETDAAPGVVPQSGTQYAFSNVETESTGGTPEWTVLYTGSNVTSFTLQSFYYGCALNLEQGAAAIPQACNIAFTGFQQGDNSDAKVQVAAQEFAYDPTSTTAAQQMALGVFNSDFNNIQFVQIQYTVPGGDAAVQSDLALVVDTIKYTTCSA